MKLIGKTTENERDEIKQIFSRKNALIELIKSLKPEDTIYEKALQDLSVTNDKFQQWWDDIAKKYNLEGTGSDKQWNIDFNTCELFLVE